MGVRAIKDAIKRQIDDIGGNTNEAGMEKMSGADLEQMRLARLNCNGQVAMGSDGTKTLGTSLEAALLATVTADGVNTITVDSVHALYVGQVIDIVRWSGTVRAENRTITAIDRVNKVVTYDGADASATIVAFDYVTRSTGAVELATLEASYLLLHQNEA